MAVLITLPKAFVNIFDAIFFKVYSCTHCPVRPLWAYTYYLMPVGDIGLPQ